MSRSLSRSEHSLLPPRPAGPAKPPPAGKPSRIPRGPYAEVKPLSKAPEAGGGGGGGKCDDELLGGKGPAVAAGAEEKPYLKVDPELVVTVLGDLEQLLFSQMLGECVHRAPPASLPGDGEMAGVLPLPGGRRRRPPRHPRCWGGGEGMPRAEEKGCPGERAVGQPEGSTQPPLAMAPASSQGGMAGGG